MDRRDKAAMNRNKAPRLNEAWKVGATQSRYSDDGHWYAQLDTFPAALFDANGYILFATEEEYRGCSHLNIGAHISIRRPGISAIPGYVFVSEAAGPLNDPDIHAEEGRHQLVLHLKCERSSFIVRKKKEQASSRACEACGFSFARAYGRAARDYCEVHHLVPLSAIEETTKTRLEDLAILCANCHRVVHLRTPEPYTLEEVRVMIAGTFKVPRSCSAGMDLKEALELL